MLSAQNDINELIEILRENIKEQWSDKKYLNKKGIDHLLEVLQERINTIFEKNKDHYIRW